MLLYSTATDDSRNMRDSRKHGKHMKTDNMKAAENSSVFCWIKVRDGMR